MSYSDTQLKIKTIFSDFYECQDQSSTYRRGLGGNFQPFFRWFPCPHIYDLSNRIFHQHQNGPHQRTSRFSFVLPIMIGIPHEKSIRFHLSLQLRRAFSLTRKCHQIYIYEATKLCMRHENSDSKQSTEAKLLLQLTSTEMLTPPENLQLLHLKSKTFSYIWSSKTT